MRRLLCCVRVLREDLDAYIDSTQAFVSGTVRLRLFKGSARVVGRRSSHSLYSHDMATYDEGDAFDQGAAVGFIHLYGLPARIQARARGTRPEDNKGGGGKP